ncbi:UDP-N-acetylglucosamine 1-carboxyvinyltransferase, partial [bacterium]|nr:UDP-N-acetylglucosamine 1-carboxyvinyltransferase [bacterium]
MGARIRRGLTGELLVEGVAHLAGMEHPVIPDRIEAGTLLMGGAITGGDVTVLGCRPEHMPAQLGKMREMGIDLQIGERSIRARAAGPLRSVSIRTLPFPGFPTDMQAQFMAALCLAQGESVITETIYPDRFIHAAELVRMGADIRVDNGTARVRGVKTLEGASVMASDLRASAALILAGLAAQGRTECLRVYHLDRGYERLEEKFRNLGAEIVRVSS